MSIVTQRGQSGNSYIDCYFETDVPELAGFFIDAVDGDVTLELLNEDESIKATYQCPQGATLDLPSLAAEDRVPAVLQTYHGHTSYKFKHNLSWGETLKA